MFPSFLNIFPSVFFSVFFSVAGLTGKKNGFLFSYWVVGAVRSSVGRVKLTSTLALTFIILAQIVYRSWSGIGLARRLRKQQALITWFHLAESLIKPAVVNEVKDEGGIVLKALTNQFLYFSF